MYLFFSRFLLSFLLRIILLAALVHKRIPDRVHGGTSLLPQAALSRPFLDSFRPPQWNNKYRDVRFCVSVHRSVLCVSRFLKASTVEIYQRVLWCLFMCILSCVWKCVCALGCLLVLTVCSCLLSFNLDSGIDILPTGSCYNFLDVRYYAAWQLSAISKSLNLMIIHRALKKKKRSICLKHSESSCD